MPIDATALTDYRYERIVEDVGEFGESLVIDQGLGEEAWSADAELAMRFFERGGDVDLAEAVATHRLVNGIRLTGR